MTGPLDPMLPVEPGSEADRIMRDHRAMEAMRKYRIDVDFLESTIEGRSGFFAFYGRHQPVSDDPAEAILACAAAIEAASTDSGHRQA